MKKIPILLISILLLSAFPLAFAQDDAEPEVSAGITPDSPLWGLDRALERIRMIMTFRTESKVNYGLHRAEERLSEMSEMGKLNKSEEVKEAEKERELTLNEAVVLARGLTGEKRQHVVTMFSKHIERLREVKEQVPLQAKDSIEKAIMRGEKKIEQLSVPQ